MQVTAKTLDKFDDWLAEGGRGEGTRRLYRSNVRCCAEHPKGMIGRLIDSDLAPKTLHTNKAALDAWAAFSEDAELMVKLKRLRLPPSVRVRPQREHPRTDWRKLMDVVGAERMPEARRAALLIMGRRGLRVSDVLRMRRREISDALRTGTLSFEVKGRRRLEYSAGPIRDALETLAGHKGAWDRVEELLVTPGCKEPRRAAAKTLTRSLDRCARIAGIDATHLHRLRRTYSVLYLAELAGDPQALIKLQQHMGWATIDTAAQYVDAVNRDELDAIGERMIKKGLDR